LVCPINGTGGKLGDGRNLPRMLAHTSVVKLARSGEYLLAPYPRMALKHWHD
jgi:hypothetical protein